MWHFVEGWPQSVPPYIKLLGDNKINQVSFFVCVFLTPPHLPSPESYWEGIMCALLNLKFPAFERVTCEISFKHIYFVKTFSQGYHSKPTFCYKIATSPFFKGYQWTVLWLVQV